MDTKVFFLVFLTGLLFVGVASDGHAPSPCQQHLMECTGLYSQSEIKRSSLETYKRCLEDIREMCSNDHHNAETWGKMSHELDMILSRYNESPYDLTSAANDLHLPCLTLVGLLMSLVLG